MTTLLLLCRNTCLSVTPTNRVFADVNSVGLGFLAELFSYTKPIPTTHEKKKML